MDNLVWRATAVIAERSVCPVTRVCPARATTSLVLLVPRDRPVSVDFPVTMVITVYVDCPVRRDCAVTTAPCAMPDPVDPVARRATPATRVAMETVELSASLDRVAYRACKVTPDGLVTKVCPVQRVFPASQAKLEQPDPMERRSKRAP